MKIGIAQINGSFSKQSYIPFSAGLLEANARTFSNNASEFEFFLPLFKRQPIRDMVRHLEGVEVLALSLYVWNEQVSLELARRVKLASPSAIVVVGGPQVPDDASKFLRSNKAIDIAIHGEGERTFSRLLENPIRGAFINLQSVSYIDGSGAYIKTTNIDRERNLDNFVSPYLSGAFDSLIRAFPDEDWTALWETNRGCPFSCTFCDWGSNTASKIGKYSTERLISEIDWFSKNKIKFIYCCDANYGMLARDLEIAEYIALKKRETGFPEIFSVQNTKNSTEKSFQAQKVISRAGLSKGVSLSMQSLDQRVLKLIRRDNIHQDSYDFLQYKFSKDRIETYSDLIIGLPGETYSSFKSGVEYLVRHGQHNRIRFNNLTVLPNAEIGNVAYQKLHGIELVKTKAVHVYGEQEVIDDDVEEFQYLVIGTNAARGLDWVRTRAFAWMTDLVYFDKNLQIPLLVAQRYLGKPLQELIELFMNAGWEHPVFYGISKFFSDKAAAIQSGDEEYCFSGKFLNSYWKADEFMLMSLVEHGDIDAYYLEAKHILRGYLSKLGSSDEEMEIVDEAIGLNRALLKMPNDQIHTIVASRYNLLKWYQEAILGDDKAPNVDPVMYEIDKTSNCWVNFHDWCREVVWYGNRTGAYLHNSYGLSEPVHCHDVNA